MLNIRFLDQEDMFYPNSEHIMLLMSVGYDIAQ